MSDKMIITHERYTLTLRHEFVGPDGQPHHLEEPISVSYVVPYTDEGSLPSSAWIERYTISL